MPPGIVDHWKGYVQQKCKGDGDILQKAVKEYVQQFVLELPIDNTKDQKVDVDKMFRPRKGRKTNSCHYSLYNFKLTGPDLHRHHIDVPVVVDRWAGHGSQSVA